MISRRGLFRLLGGLAASPVLKPLLEGQRFSVWMSGIWRNRSIDPRLDVYFSEQLLTNLCPNTPLMASLRQNPLPLHSGKTIQFFTFKPEEIKETK